MKLLPGQSVKILFRNGTSVEGVVDVWSSPDFVLVSNDGNSILIIQDPTQDIMAVKVILGQQDQDAPPPPPEHELIKETIAAKTLQPQLVNDENLRHKKLAELRIAAIEEEKKMIARKLRDHNIGEVKPVNYGYPSIINKIKGNG